MKTIKRNSTWCYKEIEEGLQQYMFIREFELCNIMQIMFHRYDNLEWQPDEDDGDDWEYPDIYQYYLVDTDNYFFEEYKENFLMSYSEKLDLWVLCVDHFGTGWKGVSSGVKIVE